jgi:non-ribosomal peptide synthetase component F
MTSFPDRGWNVLRVPVLLLILAALVGCQAATYRTLETFGIEKRDILSDRVESARDAQDEASEQFASALEQFRATVSFDGGDLEKLYDRLDREFQRSADDAERVRDRIDAIRSVADDLFEEWEEELEAYESADLRARSTELKRDTEARYVRMLGAMERAESTMDPVVQAFEDQVLFLKHNLNARAISALRAELGGIEDDTAALIEAMNASIAEANAFIRSLE